MAETGSAVLARGCVCPSCCPVDDCPAAVELGRMLAAEVSPELIGIAAGCDPTRLSPAERAVLLQLWDRIAGWAEWQRAGQMLDVCSAAEEVLDAAYQRLVDPSSEQRAGYRRERAGDPGVDEVAFALRMSSRSAQSRVAAARELRDGDRHPGLAGLVGSGVVSSWHASRVCEVVAGVDDELAAKVTVDERVKAALAHGTPHDVKRTAERVLAQLMPAREAEDRHVAARAQRDVRWGAAKDGMGWISGLMPAADVAAIAARLRAGVADAQRLGDPRTAGQVRSDMLAGWGWQGLLPLDGREPLPAETGRVVGRVSVTVPIEVLLELAEARCEVALGAESGWAPGSVARDLLGRAGTDWRRFLTDSSGMALGVSRAYRVPDDIARAVRARFGIDPDDGRLDLDHVTPWREGEALTHLGNLGPAVRRLHNHKTHGGWTNSIDPSTGAITWTTPLGQSRTEHPDLRWRPTVPDPPPPPEPGPDPPF